MPTITQRLADLTQGLGTFAGIARVIVLLCVFAVLTAVLVNFLSAKQSTAVKTETRSVVETGSMLGFFVGFYCLIRFQIGVVSISTKPITVPLVCIGLVLLVVGTCVNILGRLELGGNWGNQVRIYNDHQMVTGGLYRYVRHPLYASLIWMFCGGALVFQNGLALAANLCVFLPAMVYRGRQEETALAARFPEYAEYTRQTGMFFPKLWTLK